MLNAKIKQVLDKTLKGLDSDDARGPRLVDDAERLWKRVQKLLGNKLLTEPPDLERLELACLALQLPLRHLKLLPTGRAGKGTLRDRAEQAAEMLVGTLSEVADEALLDRTTQLLHELPHRAPTMEEAKLLADVVNLDDFGITGLLQEMIHLARTGGGITQLSIGSAKREQYGYWEARLKDGFHFEPVRDIARRRLKNSRATAALLLAELDEDREL